MTKNYISVLYITSTHTMPSVSQTVVGILTNMYKATQKALWTGITHLNRTGYALQKCCFKKGHSEVSSYIPLSTIRFVLTSSKQAEFA